MLQGPKNPGATRFINLRMSRRFMLDMPLKGLRNVKKVLENSVTEFLVLELSRVKSPGIFCSSRKKSWNFLKKTFPEFREKMEFLEFSGPRIFLSWNIPSGNFLSRDFVSRKILAFDLKKPVGKKKQITPSEIENYCKRKIVPKVTDLFVRGKFCLWKQVHHL